MNRAFRTWGPAAVWAAVLFLLSETRSFPTSQWLAVNDKVVHLALYGVLGATLAWAKRYGPSRVPHWALILVGFAYGAVDEWHQRFVPRRHPSTWDFAADVAGVVAGYLLVLLAWRLLAPGRPDASGSGDPAAIDRTT